MSALIEVSEGFVHGKVNYQSDAVPISLVTTGQVYFQRDETGSDTPPVGMEMQERVVPIQNGRLSEGKYSLDVNGFELIEHKYDHIDYFEEEEIVHKYYKEVEEFVKEYIGAKKVVAYDHNIRSTRTQNWINPDGDTTNQAIKGGNLVQGPAAIVHNDFSHDSSQRRLHQLSEKPKANDTWGKITHGEPLLTKEEIAQVTSDTGRYLFINLWRNIVDEPVQDNHLAMCDARSIKPNDLITFEIRYVDRVGENYISRYSAEHEWVYFPQMVKDEALLLKVWDSHGFYANLSEVVHHPELQESHPATFSLHTAFKDPTADATVPKRVSMEVRTVALIY
jgi:hypothetical protein